MEDYITHLYYICICTFLYIVAVIFYRLVLSPLAKFPGPRLAAATRLYETYYQILGGGTFTWHINDLHDKYGPVVRITPWEIHIKDPGYYHTVYAGPGKHRNKDPFFSFIGYPKSIFSLNSHESHRPWRKVLAQFFKRRAIHEFEPVIKANTELLCRYFSQAINGNQTLELHTAFLCYSSDTLSQYAFGRDLSLRYLHESQLSNAWKTRANSMFEFARLIRHFNFVGAIARTIPRLVSFAIPQYAPVYSMEKVFWRPATLSSVIWRKS